MSKTYECMVVLDNREVKKGWSQIKDVVNAMLTKHGATILSSKLWGERRLAYPINGQSRGTYLLIYMSANPTSINMMRRDLQLSEFVLRHLVTVCEDVPASAHEPEVAFDVATIQDEPRRAPEPLEIVEEEAVTEASEPATATVPAAEAAKEE